MLYAAGSQQLQAQQRGEIDLWWLESNVNSLIYACIRDSSLTRATEEDTEVDKCLLYTIHINFLCKMVESEWFLSI